MAGRQKLTAFEWADRMLAKGGMRRHMADMLKKHGVEYAQDWLKVHKRETRWARQLLCEGGFTCMDTETTGIDDNAEIIELAVIDSDGGSVYDGLFRNTVAVKQQAAKTHGLRDEMLLHSPTVRDEYDNVQAALLDQPLMLIYNAKFDVRMLEQTCYSQGLPDFKLPKVVDLLPRVSRWVGVWEPKYLGYAYLRLDSGHRAAGDCLGMIRLMYVMARLPIPPAFRVK